MTVAVLLDMFSITAPKHQQNRDSHGADSSNWLNAKVRPTEPRQSWSGSHVSNTENFLSKKKSRKIEKSVQNRITYRDFILEARDRVEF